MLDPDDARAVAALFGAGDEQVARDHLLSHLIAMLGRTVSDEIVFFGGTALARAYLIDGRLSEDLDLIAVGDRGEVGPCARPPAHPRVAA